MTNNEDPQANNQRRVYDSGDEEENDQVPRAKAKRKANVWLHHETFETTKSALE